jgi:hypothetical protein
MPNPMEAHGGIRVMVGHVFLDDPIALPAKNCPHLQTNHITFLQWLGH